VPEIPSASAAQASARSHITTAEIVRYCREQRWTVIGYDLQLLVRADDTVYVAVLVKDARHHFLAVSGVDLDGVLGLGIIDLNTANARFARLNTGRSN
jgi:hypothetical protein